MRALVWLGVLLLVLLAWQLRQVLVLIFLVVLFAAGLYQPIAWLEARGLRASRRSPPYT